MALHRADGGRSIGIFPGRYPRALLDAMGLLAVEIWDPPLEPERSAAHLQPFVCSVAHRGLELLLATKPQLDALLFPHICDTLQNLFTIVKDCVHTGLPSFMFYPPRNATSEASLAYLTAQVQALAVSLEAVAGRACADSDLAAALEQDARADAATSALYEQRTRSTHGQPLSNARFYDLIRGREYLRPAHFESAATAALKPAGNPLPAPAVRVLLSGILPDQSLMSILDERNVAIVEDDLLSCGRRFHRQPINGPGDPWAQAANRLLTLPPCSTVASSIEERVTFITHLYDQSKAQAIIFHTVKFCELELFDHPHLVDRLQGRGIPILMLETELHPAQTGGLATRLDAFLEMLA